VSSLAAAYDTVSGAATIEQGIAAARSNPVEPQNLSGRVVEPGGQTMADPVSELDSLVDLYLQPFTEVRNLGDAYDLMPDRLAVDLYGSHDLAQLLLRLNRAPSRYEFRGPLITVLSPAYLQQLLDAVKLAGQLAAPSRAAPPSYGDLTLREVVL
jgi:hypothetical protein